MQAFAPPIVDQCCLCGSNKSLSGEHKVEAAALRSEFGTQRMIIGRPGEPYRHAQSPKSKQFHFSARVCEACNNARTQPADLAFDAFRTLASDLMKRGQDPAQVFDDPRFCANGGPQYLDVFRYFAKLMCCHLAEMGATFHKPIADFAIGFSDDNYVLLGVDADVGYRRLQEEGADYSYAAHGGLIVTGTNHSDAPEAFHSTLTLGPVRYFYRIHLNEAGQVNLRNDHPSFYQWCERRIRHARANPMSDEERELLALSGRAED